MNEDKNPIQVADRIFLVIETLASIGPCGLMELSNELHLNKTTVHRILNSLLYMGYVKQDPSTSKYRLGFKLLDIANQILAKIDIVNIAKPFLHELAQKTGETVHLVELDTINAVYIDKVESSQNSVRMVSKVGKSIPLYCSGVGKALLSEMTDNDITRVWNQSEINPVTIYTITDFQKFMECVKEIRTTGYALDNEENEIGVRCIAAALKDFTGMTRYAFSLSAPVNRMSDTRITKLNSDILLTKHSILQALNS
ncbi:MAG: IclR family transcriptional regulator [Velocimicrobium sp.]